MSTHSTISVLYNNGTVKSIYCHSDGYFSYNGVMLLKNYYDINKINELINLGNISFLEQEVHPTNGSHSFYNRQPGVTVAYGRDRGEKEAAVQHSSLENFITNGNIQGYDYVYKEKNQTWYFIKNKKLNKLLSLVKTRRNVEEKDLKEIQTIIEKQKLNKKLNQVLTVKKAIKSNVKI